MKKKILVTGAAGFIGHHLCKKLLLNDFDVIGFDNLNEYYDSNLKKDRLTLLSKLRKKNDNFLFIKGDLSDNNSLKSIFKNYNPQIVINLAAQAGVRYSLKNPAEYINSNIVGFGNLIENCKNNSVKHLIYASSSSVYGGNKKMPFSENDGVNHPISLYAATKKSNELVAHSYSHLFNLPTTGLRFFTVYGPWGRPDMSYFIFVTKILNNEPIKIFNNGNMKRDFTYIDDVIASIVKLIDKPPTKNDNFDYTETLSSESWAPYKIFNIGNSNPYNLMDFIKIIEEKLGKTAKKEFLPMQMGDVKATCANVELLNKWVGYKPKKSLKDGIGEFIDWYLNYYKK